MNRGIVLQVVALVALIISGCCIALAQEATPIAAPTNLELLPGDKLFVRIPAEPLLSGEFTISENGKLYFPVLENADMGSINVMECRDMKSGKLRGCTVPELEALIQAKLSNFFVDNSVVVELVSYTVRASHNIAIYGRLENPGSYPYFEGMHLLDAFISAGSIAEGSDLTHVRVLRDNMTITIDATNVLNGTDMENNLALMPRDYILVPTTEPQQKIKIIVLGQVLHVGSFYLPQGSTVLDALAEAGGTHGRAGLGKAYLIRVVDNRPTAVPVDFKSLITRLDLDQNRVLQNNDVLFIPESSGVNINEIMSNLSMFNLIGDLYDNYIE